MAINKVIYGDRTLIDLTEDTVSAENLMKGFTAHNSKGELIVGEGVEQKFVIGTSGYYTTTTTVAINIGFRPKYLLIHQFNSNSATAEPVACKTYDAEINPNKQGNGQVSGGWQFVAIPTTTANFIQEITDTGFVYKFSNSNGRKIKYYAIG